MLDQVTSMKHNMLCVLRKLELSEFWIIHCEGKMLVKYDGQPEFII